MGKPQDSILSQATEVAEIASVSLCTWVSALLQAVMKTREALSWTHELLSRDGVCLYWKGCSLKVCYVPAQSLTWWAHGPWPDLYGFCLGPGYTQSSGVTGLHWVGF